MAVLVALLGGTGAVETGSGTSIDHARSRRGVLWIVEEPLSWRLVVPGVSDSSSMRHLSCLAPCRFAGFALVMLELVGAPCTWTFLDLFGVRWGQSWPHPGDTP